MSGAASHRPSHLKLLLVATLAVVVAPSAAAADPRQGVSPPELWGVAANASFHAATLSRLQRGGINAVVLDSRRLRPRQIQRLTAAARRARLRVVQPALLHQPVSVADGRTACNDFWNAHPDSVCALWESSVSAAATLAQSGVADLVVVRGSSPRALRALVLSHGSRVLAIVALGRHLRAKSWRSAIQEASSSATLDLAFAPRGAKQKTVSGYLKLLDESGATSRDRRAPAGPAGLKIAQQTRTTLGVNWGRSFDNRGVAGYDVLLDGALLGRTTATAYLYSNLLCGTSHILAVKAFDAAGNRSTKSSLSAETSPCVLPPTIGGPLSSAPDSLKTSGRTTSTIALTWSPPVVALGVAGYGLYRNGVLVGSTQSTSFTFSELTCGTSYDLAVDAYDLSGRRSPKASTRWQTLACRTCGSIYKRNR